MTDSDEIQISSQPPDPAAERFYSGAIGRILHIMAAIGFVATVLITAVVGWRVGVGFAVGCVLAFVNFHWLKRAVNVLAERTTSGETPASSTSTVSRFLLRFALIGIAAYAIFQISRISLYGLLGGLFLTVAAILCEAAYESFVTMRRGF